MNRKIVEKALMIIVIIGLAIYYFVQHKTKNEIAKNHEETIGVIVDYYEVFPDHHYLNYEYFVKNKKYKNEISPDIKFLTCPDKKDCIGKKYLVYYEPTKPENSIILLDSPR